MNLWPDGAVTREAVQEVLGTPVHWRVEYCGGARLPRATGYGRALPDGVLDRIPNRPKRRKLERGLEGDKTWMFAYLSESDGETLLSIHEGP
jgi:hypothetical protein